MKTRLAVSLLLGLVLLVGCSTKSGGETAATSPEPAAVAPAPTPASAAPGEVAATTGAAPATDPRGSLIEKIDARFDDPKFANAFWGVVIQSLETGEVWYERNPEKVFMPASNEKILTTAATLMELGPDFRFETHLCHTGTIEGGTLKGNLVVFGNGDPTLYERFYKDSRDVFREFAAAIKAKGITRIAGDVIGDDNAFDDEHLGSGWSLDGLDDWYSAEFGALSLNENYIDFTIVPPKTADGAAEIRPNLPSSYYTVVNRIRVNASGGAAVSARRAYGTNEFVFTGSVGAGGRTTVLSPTITNPTAFYVTVLKEVLMEEGIAVDGKAVDCDDIAGWKSSPTELASIIVHPSPPLSEILTMLMKRSQNMFAETMPHLMAWKRDGVGTFRGGRKVVQERLAEFGVDPGSYVYRDGSGLTRYNLVSPRTLAKVLTGMRKTPHGAIWRDTMPIAGVDGTLRNRMKGTAAEKNVRAKTGTISNVRALSGYVTTADGEELVFSFLVNSHTTSSTETEKVTDDVCAYLASYRRSGAK